MKIMWLLAIVLMTAVGCEQKVENQGNFAKTDEFFKEMDSTASQSNVNAQSQPVQSAEETASTQVQPTETPASETAANVSLPVNPTINEIQQALQNANLYAGKIDGVLGPKTKKAIVDFQAQNNLKADGKVGPRTWGQLKLFLASSVQTAPVTSTDVQKTASND